MNYKQIFEETYKGKKVFLTGHTGFKGSWMLAWLHRLGAIVKGYALAPENDNDLYNLIDGDRLCESTIADIRDKEKLQKAILSFKPDFIFHMAAQPLVRRSYEMPLYTFEVNVNGTANLLEVVREIPDTCHVIIITTDKVYENKETNYAYKETDKLGGYDPYSASKAAAEIVVSSYRSSFFNPEKNNEHHKTITSARAGNVIGGGDRAKDRIIPDVIRGLEKNEPIIIRNPASIRPWQYVLEPLSGYLLLGVMLNKKPVKYTGAWNFGPYADDVMTVKEVVEKALAIFGKGNYSIPVQANGPHEAGLLKLDIQKAMTELDWHPQTNSSQAIEYTMQWYKNVTSENAFSFTMNQVDQFASGNEIH